MKAGWTTKPLGELCRIELGSTPARGRPSLWDTKRDTGNVWLSIADMPQSLHGVALDSKEYVSDTAAANMRLIPTGTLLVSFKLTLGRLAYAGRDLFTNEAIASLHEIDEARLSKRFLYWALTSFDWNKAAEGDEKVKGKTLNKAKLKVIPIPLPPLEEQQRIVTVLDEAFEGLDRARANAEANLQNARELFSVAIEASLERAGGRDFSLAELLDKKWILSHLDGNHGSNYPRKEEFVAEGVPYISANCIEGDIIDLSRCKYLSPARADTLRKGTARNRDVIFAHNATVGPVALLLTEEPRILLSTSLTHYRCNEDFISPEFLVFAMRSAGFKRQYEAVMGQATRNQVPITIQRTFTHKIPDMEAQLNIAELGNQIEHTTRELEQLYAQQGKDLAELRQSLLQKAFGGELT